MKSSLAALTQDQQAQVYQSGKKSSGCFTQLQDLPQQQNKLGLGVDLASHVSTLPIHLFQYRNEQRGLINSRNSGIAGSNLFTGFCICNTLEATAQAVNFPHFFLLIAVLYVALVLLTTELPITSRESLQGLPVVR